MTDTDNTSAEAAAQALLVTKAALASATKEAATAISQREEALAVLQVWWLSQTFGGRVSKKLLFLYHTYASHSLEQTCLEVRLVV